MCLNQVGGCLYFIQLLLKYETNRDAIFQIQKICVQNKQGQHFHLLIYFAIWKHVSLNQAPGCFRLRQIFVQNKREAAFWFINY